MSNTKQKWQEIANRGLQDRFDPQTRVKFDEAVRRGLISIPDNSTTQQDNIRGDNVNFTSGVDSNVLPNNNPNTEQQPLASTLNEDVPSGVAGEAFPKIEQDPEKSRLKTIADEVIGAAETVGTIGSSIIAEPVAGITGLAETSGRAILNALGFDAGDPTGEGTKTINAVRDFISIDPSTTEGVRNLKVVGDLTKKGVDLANIPVSGLVGIGELISGQGLEQSAKSVSDVQNNGLSSVLGQRTLEATGSPALAAMAHSLPTAALEAIGVKGLKSSKLANEKLSTNIAKAIQQAAPDIKKIQTAKSNSYAALDDFGVKVKAQSFDSFADMISNKLKKEGVDPTLTPKSTAALKRIIEAKGSDKTLTELDTLRKIAKGAANDIDKTDARLGNIIISELDNGIDKLSSQIGGKFKEARGLAQRAFKSQDIADMMENASHTASGLENGLRIEARKILKSKKRRKGFSADELAALRKIEQGTTLGNLAKFLGKFGINEGQATSMVGASFGVGGGGVIGSMFGGPGGAAVGAVTVPAIGQIAKKTAQRITKENASLAGDLVRAGRNSREITKAYLKNVPASERSISDLTDLLMDPNLLPSDVTSVVKSSKSPVYKFLSDTMFFVHESKRRLQQAASVSAIAQPELDKENKQ